MGTLAKRVLQAMQDKGCTASELARAAGVKPPSVSDWLSGKTKTLKSNTALRAAAFLGVEPLWLSEGKGPKITVSQGKTRGFAEAIRQEAQSDPYVLLESALRALVIVGSDKDEIIALVKEKAEKSKEIQKAMQELAGKIVRQ